MKLKWSQISEGVWQSFAGKDFCPIVTSRKIEKKNTGSKNEFPFRKNSIECSKKTNGIVLSIPLDQEEKLYGLGTNFKLHNIRGNVFELKADHYGGKDNGSTHAPVPFYVSNKGYGVFVNVSERIKVYAGTTHNTKNPHPPIFDRLDPKWCDVSLSQLFEFLVPGKGLEVLVFKGKNMLEVVEKFNMYCGGGCMPPKWGLGFWHRVKIDYNEKDTLAEVSEFEKHRIPLQVLGLEPGWHSSSYPCTYEFKKEAFPDPEKFCEALRGKGIRVNLWENCMVHPESKLAEKLAGRCGDYYAGWGGLIPDLNDKKACNIFAEFHEKNHINKGISGYKLDECDGFDQWLWPDHAQFPSGVNGVQIRQKYGLLYQQMIYNVFKSRNERTYGLVRASNAGAAPLPFVLYNDCYAHRDFITGMLNAAFCGLLFTPEARSARTSEEWLRRLQAVCMSPLAMLNAWGDGTKPWSFEDVTDKVREVIELRLKLIPYLYTAFARYHFKGTPPFRPMVLEDSFMPPAQEKDSVSQDKIDTTENPYSKAVSKDLKDQYMMGDSMLVAPLFAGEKERFAVLPEGRWYDFYTGKYAGSRESVKIAADFKDIPIFVKDGALIPLFTKPELSRNGAAELEIRHYGEKPGSFELYDDDGETFAYEKGESCLIAVNAEKIDGKWTGSFKKKSGSYKSKYTVKNWSFEFGR